MSKKKKKEVTMIDMTARLNVKIIPGTDEEINQLKKELDEINELIERRMQLYEENLRSTILSIMDEEIFVSNQDAEYFINTYEKMIENRNIENIKNRLDKYHVYLSEKQNKS